MESGDLTLLGGTVASTGTLAAPDGQVTVSAIPGSSYVRLTQAGQLLSLEVKPLSTSATQPNVDSLPIASLPQLLTGAGADSATGLTVNPDGTVQLTGSAVAVNPGDVTVKRLNAGTATLSAANALSLVDSQIATAKDLSLSGQTVTVQGSVANPVSVHAGGTVSIKGSSGVDVGTDDASDVAVIQSGGDLRLSSDGLISANASLLSGGNLSFVNLTGGPGNFVNSDQTSLQSKGVVNLGNYTGISLKVTADGSIRAGNITITGPKTSGVDQSDPDYNTLTNYPALILRAGLVDPASIISVGNVTAHGGVVDFSTNGNIFTGNVDVSGAGINGIWGGGTIKLQAFNIFSGNLNAASTAGPMPTPRWEWSCYLSDGISYGSSCEGTGVYRYPAGSISLDATQYMRTGDIDASSKSERGGDVSIQAGDAIVGSINTNGSSDVVSDQFYGLNGLTNYTYSFNGGNVSVKTDTPFVLGVQSGTISTSGGQQKGTVSIGKLDTTIVTDNSDLPTVNPVDLLAIASPQEQARVRANIIQFLEARRLAGQKLTAQEIADRLDIPLDIAQIAVFIPIGDDVKIPVPNVSNLFENGVLVAGDFSLPFDCDGGCKIIAGAVVITFAVVKGTGEIIVTIFDKAGNFIGRKTGDAARGLYQRFFASQHGRGNQGDSGILREANERIQQGTAKNMEDALNQLMKEARHANNGKEDKARIARIRKTQKAVRDRPSRETKDKKKN